MRRLAAALACLTGTAFAASIACAESAQPQPAQPPEPTLQAKHGEWEVRCFGPQECIMTQFHARQPNTADAVFTVIKPQGLNDERGQPIEALAEIVVPLGVYIPAGLGLQVDSDPPKAAPYERCIPEGCLVRAPISQAMIGRMKSGATAYLIVSSAPGTSVKVPISLKGFTAAFGSF